MDSKIGIERERVVVLSPHLDDAVFSVWHALSSQADVEVVTVFAGVPRVGFVSPLDKSGGAEDSAARVRERQEDDTQALSRVGRSPIHIDLLDVQYRIDHLPGVSEQVARDPSHFLTIVAAHDEARIAQDELKIAVDPHVSEASLVYAPAGIGSHPDHCDVARYGVRLFRDGARVRFYGDVPYFVRRGLPSWLSGRPNHDADELVDEALRALTFDPSSLHRRLVRLSAFEMARKLEALRCYSTEFDPANKDFGGALDNPEIMQWEVYWTASNS